MVDGAIASVEVGDHGLFGRPGQFERMFDLLRRQQIGDEVFPSHAGIVQRRAVFPCSHLQCPLILGFPEVIDLQASDALVGM